MLYVGVDLGQRKDHSAIAVVERVDRRSAYQSAEFDRVEVRHLERVPLGTPYPAVVTRVTEVLRRAQMWGQCVVVVDATGVGAPVVDLLRGAGLGCEVVAVTITGGDRETQSGSMKSVPKRDLMVGLQVLLERGELKIARLKETGALVRELMDVRMTSSGTTGRVRMGAEGCGEHDDLVIAVALACWRAKKPQIGFGDRRLF
jgi:phage FluMu gp28-like protein